MAVLDLHPGAGPGRGRLARARARAADIRGRGLVFGLILATTFAAHLLVGGALITRDALRGWHPPEWDVAARAEDSELPSAIARLNAALPPHDTILYATPSADDYRFWSYAFVSALVYPRTVWWSTPQARRSPIDWWVQAPFEVRAVLALARQRGAAAALMDWNEQSAPAGVDTSAVEDDRLLMLLPRVSPALKTAGRPRP